MTFWDAHADAAVSSEVGKLASANAPLERLFDEVSFVDEVYSQTPELIAYLEQEPVIKKMLAYMYEVVPQGDIPYQKLCSYAYCAHTVFANLIPQVTQKLVESKSNMTLFFSVAGKDESQFITAMGYFASVFRQLISDNNSTHQDLFISMLIKNKDAFMMPLVENMTRSNAEVIKSIFDCRKPELEKLQLSFFEYMLFFNLNEKFTDMKGIEERFDNVAYVFAFLAKEKIFQKFKAKYVPNLFLNTSIKYKNLTESIFVLKLAILNYLAETEQIKSDPNILKLFSTFELCKSSHRLTSIMTNILRFLKTVSASAEFQASFDLKMLSKMFDVLQKFPKNDVVIQKVFNVLMNVSDSIKNSFELSNFLAERLLAFQPQLFKAGENNRTLNPVPLSLIYQLLDKIKDPIGNEPLRSKLAEWKANLDKEFEPINVDMSLSNVNHSDVKLVIKNDFPMFDGVDGQEEIVPVNPQFLNQLGGNFFHQAGLTNSSTEGFNSHNLVLSDFEDRHADNSETPERLKAHKIFESPVTQKDFHNINQAISNLK